MNDAAEVTVRPMRPHDAEPVAELAAELGYQRTPAQIRRWLAALGDTPRQTAFVAEHNREVVGWIEVSVEWRLQSEMFGLIGGLVVREGLRGAGVGKRLCERAEAWTRDQGASRIRVTSRSTREGAHRFYLRDGYHEIKISTVFEKALGA